MKIKQLGLFALLFAQAGFAQETDEKLMAKAKKIHEKVITIDTHNDINVNNFTHDHNYTEDLDTQVNLPKMDEGDLDVSWLIVYTGQGDLDAEGYKKAYDNAISKFEAIHRLTEEIAPDEMGLATTSKEVRKLVKQGKKVAMIGVENGYPIGTDIKNVEKFYDMGARYMSLAHNGHSQLSDSNTGEADDEWLNNGLSDLGKEVIKEMNRLGIMIDVSHPSKEAIKQMFKLSKAPLIASHSSARALCDHSRNLDDELLALFDKHGGVIQTVAFSSYVNTEKHEAFNAAKTEVYEAKAKEVGFEMLSWGEVRELSEDDREKYIENYRKLVTESDKEVEALKTQIEKEKEEKEKAKAVHEHKLKTIEERFEVDLSSLDEQKKKELVELSDTDILTLSKEMAKLLGAEHVE